MDCLSTTSTVQRVVMMFAAQTGKTESGSNWLGYVIAHAPGPMLLVQPTVEMAKRLSKQRLESLISETPVLTEKIAPARARDSGNTMFAKEFPGGMMLLTGANSATGLRSTPCRYIFMDEIDAFPADVDGEGDPVSLAEKRATTFARRKILLTSTPTVKDFSRIEAEYERSDQRRFFVPCPRKAPASAVIGNLECFQTGGLQLCNFGVQPAPTFHQIRHFLAVAEVHLIDDGQHRNLKQDGVQPGPTDRDVDLAAGQGGHMDVFLIEPEQAQEVDKIALDKAHRAQVIELRILKLQAAQRTDFLADLRHVRSQRLHTRGSRVAALEAVLHLRARELMQHHLHHGEFVQIGVEQTADDHDAPA
jgi:hypothetical protein